MSLRHPVWRIHPTQSIMYVPLQVNRSQKYILLIVQYKYINFILQNLILRTRLCGTGFITQPSCVLEFHLTESVRRKWFVLAVYQFWKGISAGPALKYFTWFIGAGGNATRDGIRMCINVTSSTNMYKCHELYLQSVTRYSYVSEFVCVNIRMWWLFRLNYRSLLQKRPIKETLFCKRDLYFCRTWRYSYVSEFVCVSIRMCQYLYVSEFVCVSIRMRRNSCVSVFVWGGFD